MHRVREATLFTLTHTRARFSHQKEIIMKIIQPIGNFHLSSSSQKLIIIKQQASHLRNYPSFLYHPSILVTSAGNNFVRFSRSFDENTVAFFHLWPYIMVELDPTRPIHTCAHTFHAVWHGMSVYFFFSLEYNVFRQGQYFGFEEMRKGTSSHATIADTLGVTKLAIEAMTYANTK